MLDANGKQIKPAGKRPHATTHEKGAAVDMYLDGLSYRRVARNMEQYFGRETSPASVYNWVRELSGTAGEILRPMKVDTGREWAADEMMVNVGGQRSCSILLGETTSPGLCFLPACTAPTPAFPPRQQSGHRQRIYGKNSR